MEQLIYVGGKQGGYFLWFKDTYEPTDKNTDILKMREILADFKDGNYYENLTKKEKRKLTAAKFKEELLSTADLKKS